MIVALPRRDLKKELVRPFASGGEAKVFELIVAGRTNAAKVYDAASDANRQERCEAWFENPPFDIPTRDGRVKFAVPTEPLTDPKTGRFVGYLMWFVRDAVKLVLLIDPGSDKFQPLPVRIVLASRLASLLAELETHCLDPVFADLNDENVLVGPAGHPTLIDIDSNQVTDGAGKVLRSPWAKLEYLPPELQGKNLMGVDRTRRHHNFAVAVLLYRMIMNGTHPYDAVGHPAFQPEARILAGVFPYAPGAKYAPSPHAPRYETIAPALRELFLRAFHAGHCDPDVRPTIGEWAAALEREVAQPYQETLDYKFLEVRRRIGAGASVLTGMGFTMPGKRWAIAGLVIALYAATIVVTATFARGGRELPPITDVSTPLPLRLPGPHRAYREPTLVRELRAEIRAEAVQKRGEGSPPGPQATTLNRVARWLDPRGYLPGGQPTP